MAIKNTTKYKVFKKYQSLDNGVTWVVVEPEEAEYMAWERNSIECGYTLPQYTSGIISGYTTERCSTIVTYPDGTIEKFNIEGSLEQNSVHSKKFLPSTIASANLGNCISGISEGACASFKNLSAITIPDTVSYIGSEAFRYCPKLVSINIPNGINKLLFATFADCYSLQKIDIPSSVTYFDQSVFGNCSGLTSINIPDSVTYIGGGCFSRCTNLASLNIGKGVTKIGYGSFQECKSLKTVIIPSSVSVIQMNAFLNCTGLNSISIPSSVTKIEERVFSGCTSLGTINYSGNVEQWGAINIRPDWNDEVPATVVHCTDGDVNLVDNDDDIIIPDKPYDGSQTILKYKDAHFNVTTKTYDPNDASYKDFLRSIFIGTGWETIPANFLSFCTSLKVVSIANGTKFINEYAFQYSPELSYVRMPSSVTRINEGAFLGCVKLEELIYDGTIEQWNSIRKDFQWNTGIPATVVHCTDGDVTL